VLLDRMTIEDAGANPQKLAYAIHRQLALRSGWVRIDEIAAALGIIEIRYEEFDSFEGALITRPERDMGMILVKASQNERRRRFTIAHELGHFLSP
jgi:Zn-dependent peptidase ImmA (M78 family)